MSTTGESWHFVAVRPADYHWVSVPLADGAEAAFGRSPQALSDGGAVLCTDSMDGLVSRHHGSVTRQGQQLVVRRDPRAKHPLVDSVTRKPLPDEMSLAPGGAFSIHPEGCLVFHWVRHPSEIPGLSKAPPTRSALVYDAVPEPALREQLAALQHDLPLLLHGWKEEKDLFLRMARFLHHHLGSKGELRVRFLGLTEGPAGLETCQILGHDDVPDHGFRPSRQILGELCSSGGLRMGQPRTFTSQNQPPDPGKLQAHSLDYAFDWILALPVGLREENGFLPCRHRGRSVVLYIECRQGLHTDASVALPLANLVASLTASLAATREGQRIRDQLGSFFSKRIRDLVSAGRLEALEPVLRECTVLFCDRKGSSAVAERAASPEGQMQQLQENRSLLEIVAHSVERTGGTVADFAGDGLLAFWGWPDGAEAKFHAWQAVAAARDMAGRIASMHVASAGDFPLRIGVHTGLVAVGQIGPPSHFKIGVFGDAVNVGSRLEGLGKQFRVPILLSEESVRSLTAAVPEGQKLPLTRRLGRIIPKGMSVPCSVHELVVPDDWGGSGIGEVEKSAYEEALSAFELRQWADCMNALRRVDFRRDKPSAWLMRRALQFDGGSIQPPQGWRGEITAEEK